LEGETIEMKKLKNLIIIAAIFGFTVAGFAAADPGDLKVQSLNHQIKEEIVDVLNLPVYLSFCDKNITGKATVIITVEPNGKIKLVGVNGANKILNSYLSKKISSRNLWTGTNYKGNVFIYEINLAEKPQV